MLNLLWLFVAFRTHFFGALVERSSHTGVYFVHLLIFGLGAYWVFKNELTIGTLVAFETTFLSMGYALTEVNHYIPTLAQAVGSIHHLDDLFVSRRRLSMRRTRSPCHAWSATSCSTTSRLVTRRARSSCRT